MMSANELDTAVRSRVRLLVVVLNDCAYGAEIKHLQHLGLPLEAAYFDSPDLSAIARAVGGDGRIVRTLEELRDALIEFTVPSTVAVLDVRISREIALM
jgi:thiamine pyrophosphate-dependent acetolactate synthase large subunit-like protein